MQDKKVTYILLGLITALFLGMSTLGYLFYKSTEKLNEANNIIAASVDEIQEFSKKLGLSESKLRRQEDLADKFKDELGNLGKDFAKLKDKYDLDIRSRDRTIAGLNGKIKGGKTAVTTPSSGEFTTIVEVTKEMCGDKVVAYQWSDDKNRFKLKDPDIFEKDNETFEYKQHFEIKGYVFADKTGDIQIKKIELREVHPTGKDEPKYEVVEGSDITLVSSTFEYTNKIQDGKSLLDIATLRPIATFDTAIMPGVGLEIANLGRYFDYLNFGLYSKLSVDVSDPWGGSLQNSRVGLGINYHLLPPLLNTNFAVGVSVSTPFNDLGQAMLSVDLILYLTDDLNPFQWLSE